MLIFVVALTPAVVVKMASSQDQSATPETQVVRVPMCALAKRVPAVKVNASHEDSNKIVFEHDALVESINIMWAHPDLRRDGLDFLKKELMKKMVRQSHGEDALLSVSTLANYDEVWMASYVARKIKVSLTTLGKAKTKDPKFLMHCVTFLLKATGGTHVPGECKSHEVMHKCLDDRIAEVGDRHKLLEEAGPTLVDQDGNIDWAAGVYKPVPDAEGIVLRVIHRPTNVPCEVPKELGVTTQWKIDCNFDDMMAQFYLNKYRKFTIRDLTWPANQGPFERKGWKGHVPAFQHNAVEVKKSLDERRRHTAASGRAAMKEEYVTPRKELKAAGAKRAREMLQQQSSQKHMRRRASIPELTG